MIGTTMTYDYDKLIELLLLDSALSYRDDEGVGPHEISDTALPEVTDEDREVAKTLPTDILESLDELRHRRKQPEDAAAEATAILMRGNSDIGTELEIELQEREDEELRRQEDTEQE